LKIPDQIQTYIGSLLEPKRSEIEVLHLHILQLLPNDNAIQDGIELTK
jgi:hypothetical protein